MTIYNRLILIIFISSFCSISNLFSQTCDSVFYKVVPGSKLECLQGIHRPTNNNNPKSETFLISKGHKTLGLILKKNGSERTFYELNIGFEGFYDFPEYESNYGSYSVVDSFKLCDLRQDGPHYVSFLEKEIDESGWVKNPTTQPEYICDAGFIESSDRSLTMYEPLDFLPYEAFKQLKIRALKDNRDYISEFEISAKIKKAKVRVAQSYFYDGWSESKKRKGFVVEGDEVFIDRIAEDWIRVAYEGNTSVTKGWLKKEDLEIIE